MPGVASLEAARYYAHPRNGFWPIVLALLDGGEPVLPRAGIRDGRSGSDGTGGGSDRGKGVDRSEGRGGRGGGGCRDGGEARTGRVRGGTALDPDTRGGSSALLPPYERRVARLHERGIALWDVLAECERPGSLDTAIRRDSERANDVPALVARHPELRLVAFNGQTAARLYTRHVGAAIEALRPDLALVTLPSTSPAYASLSLAAKHARWRDALGPVLTASRRGSKDGT